MARIESKGKCALCGGSYAKNGMTRHLKSCIEKNVTAGNEGSGKLLPVVNSPRVGTCGYIG